MTNSNYKKVIVQWQEFEIPQLLPRRITINLSDNFVIAIIGPRRAGKTYTCFQLIKNLRDSGVPNDNTWYINLEDEKLIGANAEDLDALLNTIYELYQPDEKYPLYLFLDEIQNIKNWDVWVRRISEMRKNIRLILSGSSAKLLSKELSTKLRGRVIAYEIFPLSFLEYLNWNNVEFNEKTISWSKQRSALKKLFKQYLQEGGYPAVFSHNVPRELVLQQYFDSMILRDVAERYEVRDIKKLKILAHLAFESISKELSYSKLYNKLKSLGYELSKNTVIEYLLYLEDAYLFFQNIKFEYSLSKQLGSIKKIYCIDTGLLNAVSFKFSDDFGRLLENLIYLELKRRGEEIYYHRKNHECDFILKKKNKITDAIQVSYELSDENEKREVSGLIEAMKTYNLQNGTIITFDQEGEKEIDGRIITLMPAWRWCIL